MMKHAMQPFNIEIQQDQGERHNMSSSNDDDDDDDEEEGDGNAELPCICGIPHKYNKYNFWIQCFACESWYEVESKCVGFARSENECLEHWTCTTPHDICTNPKRTLNETIETCTQLYLSRQMKPTEREEDLRGNHKTSTASTNAELTTTENPQGSNKIYQEQKRDTVPQHVVHNKQSRLNSNANREVGSVLDRKKDDDDMESTKQSVSLSIIATDKEPVFVPKYSKRHGNYKPIGKLCDIGNFGNSNTLS
jgi:hypothetical protein